MLKLTVRKNNYPYWVAVPKHPEREDLLAELEQIGVGATLDKNCWME